jgi:hypothetical protein
MLGLHVRNLLAKPGQWIDAFRVVLAPPQPRLELTARDHAAPAVLDDATSLAQVFAQVAGEPPSPHLLFSALTPLLVALSQLLLKLPFSLPLFLLLFAALDLDAFALDGDRDYVKATYECIEAVFDFALVGVCPVLSNREAESVRVQVVANT